jgi:nicotinamidase-related amidase
MSEEKPEIEPANKGKVVIPREVRQKLGIKPDFNDIIDKVMEEEDDLDELITSKATQKLDPNPASAIGLALVPRRTAIVVIDLQKGIVGMPGGGPHAKADVIANCARLLNAARTAGAQPILVHVDGSPDGADRLKPTSDQPMRSNGALPPDWSELIPELDRQPSDIVILKRQWGAFYGTDLDLQLRRRGLGTIVLCGISTEFGVESTARDAYERGYELIFAEDAMTGSTAESHANSVGHIFPRMGRVRSTEEILTALKG